MLFSSVSRAGGRARMWRGRAMLASGGRKARHARHTTTEARESRGGVVEVGGGFVGGSESFTARYVNILLRNPPL